MAWTPVIIGKKVGPGLDNNEEDVKKIQTLLNVVRIGPKLQVNGLCDKDTVTALGNFQQIWGNPDFRIEPGGTTLRRLNDTAKPLTLKTISLIKIRSGGYAITYQGFVPPKGYRVMLYFSASFAQVPSDAVDITRQGLANKQVTTKLDINNTLPEFLKLIESKGAWGGFLACNIYQVRDDGHVVSVSNQINVQAPVKPYDGPVRLNMASIDPSMYYVGIGLGRYFYPQSISGRRYFAYGGKFETDPEKRGFDCTTYAGTVLGLDPLKGELGVRGDELAELVHAEECRFEYAPGKTKVMEKINGSMLKYFFTNNSAGAFIVWTSGHVMLVVDNVVHEFNLPVGKPGYYRRDVRKRPWGTQSNLNIRKIPSGRLSA